MSIICRGVSWLIDVAGMPHRGMERATCTSSPPGSSEFLRFGALRMYTHRGQQSRRRCEPIERGEGEGVYENIQEVCSVGPLDGSVCGRGGKREHNTTIDKKEYN